MPQDLSRAEPAPSVSSHISRHQDLKMASKSPSALTKQDISFNLVRRKLWSRVTVDFFNVPFYFAALLVIFADISIILPTVPVPSGYVRVPLWRLYPNVYCSHVTPNKADLTPLCLLCNRNYFISNVLKVVCSVKESEGSCRSHLSFYKCLHLYGSMLGRLCYAFYLGEGHHCTCGTQGIECTCKQLHLE